MKAYLDNAATTSVDAKAVEVMERAFREDFANPSSLHKMGFEAEQYVKSARDTFSRLLKCGKKNLVFTSGGTEGNNTAIVGTALFKESRGKHILVSAIEHPSVSEPVKFLKGRGWDIEVLPVDSEGYVSAEDLKQRIRSDTVLVSVMHVNNEIGTVEPVEELGAVVREANPDCFFHVDDIQGFGKIGLDIKKAGIDFLTASAHKIHGPKGSGLLYISDRASHIPPFMQGGGQQDGLRSGTVNVPGIAGFECAAGIAFEGMDEAFERVRGLKKSFLSGLSDIEGISLKGPEEGSPYITSLTVEGIRAEVLLHALEEYDIFISSGSACASNKAHKVSPTLSGIGASKEDMESTVRFSFSRETTAEETEYTVDALHTIIPGLRRFKRR